MPPDKEGAPPGGSGTPEKNVDLARLDFPTDTAQAHKKQEHRHRADFARDIVFTEFVPRDAKALDQGDHIDRKPNAIIRKFDCSGLPATVAAEVEAATARIQKHIDRTVEAIVRIGSDLQKVKSKLEHGQFERWIDISFNMTTRTAQKYMRAAEWMADKNELSSHLTPNSIYLLSAKSTPEGVHEQVVERLEGGLLAEPEYIRHVIQDAKLREREAKNTKGKREARDARKRRESPPEEIKNTRECQRANARAEKQRKKKEQSERESLAANFILRAQDLAIMLVDDPKVTARPLVERTEDELNQTLRNFDILYKKLRGALLRAHQSHSDNVTLFPPKPWEPKP